MSNPNPTYKFKKGQSGNPAGRPKDEWTWSGLLKEMADKQDGKSKKKLKKAIAKALFDQAKTGNIKAIREFGNRIDGRAKQQVDVTSRGKSLKGLIHIE